MKKQFIAFFLSALMIGSALTVLSSCSDKDKPGSSSGPGSGSNGGGGTTGPGTTAVDQLKPGVPEGVRFDTDGKKTPINFVIAETDEDGFNLRSIKLDADEVDEGDKVDVAVDARNATFGPNDLSGSIGKPGAVFDPETTALIEKSLRILRGAGKYTGLATGDTTESVLRYWADMGFELLASGSDYGLFKEACVTHIARLRNIVQHV